MKSLSNKQLALLAMGALAGCLVVYQRSYERKVQERKLSKMKMITDLTDRDSSQKIERKSPMVQAKAKHVQGFGNIFIIFF